MPYCQVLPPFTRDGYKPDKMMTELRHKLELRDLGQEEVDRGSSLSRGLDGRIVMEISNEPEVGRGDQRPRKRKSLVESLIGSLGRKKVEKKEFSDSASRFDIYHLCIIKIESYAFF